MFCYGTHVNSKRKKERSFWSVKKMKEVEWMGGWRKREMSERDRERERERERARERETNIKPSENRRDKFWQT